MFPRIKLVNWIEDKGYPTNSPKYHRAHCKANAQEKKKFGKKHFEQLNKIIRENIPTHQLAGTHKRGIIEVSKKIPARPKWMRKEVRYHELIETEAMGI